MVRLVQLQLLALVLFSLFCLGASADGKDKSDEDLKRLQDQNDARQHITDAYGSGISLRRNLGEGSSATKEELIQDTQSLIDSVDKAIESLTRRK